MINAVGNEIENSAKLRALVDINFRRTRKFFIGYLIMFTILCMIPFVAM